MKNLFRIKSLALIAFVAILSISCDDDDPAPVVDNTITAKAVSSPNLSILVQALTKAKLAGTLQGAGPFTVFAPTNAAFEKYLADNKIASLDAIPTDKLKQILLNHVVSGKVLSTQLTTGYIKTEATFGTTTSKISMYVNTATTPGTKLLNGVANVSTPNVEASNGVIHIVDAVIDVPTIVTHAVANASFSTLASVLTAQGLIPTLSGTVSSPFTVFAPLNSAFNPATLELYGGLSSDNKSAVLKHHVVTGLNVLSSAIPTTPIPTFQGQNISIAGIVITDGSGGKSNIVVSAVDVQCGNGVIHAIDKVLLPNLAD
jgi:uncharacterized surface protein with fasciclin (FAS1) repeats